MKIVRIALLAGAALVVAASGAHANELDALKLQLETLNARVAQMEAAPTVPHGYSILSLSDGEATVVPGNNDAKDSARYDKSVTKVSVLPTADAPAAASVEWSGYVYAMLRWNDAGFAPPYDGDEDLNVFTRGQLRVVGKTDTGVGEVGVRVQLRAESWGSVFGEDVSNNWATRPGFQANEYWGWWGMTPELTLGGGFSGSLGDIGYGYDGACTCWGTDFARVDLDPGDVHQMRLSYASGPFGIAIALEDNSASTKRAFRGGPDSMGVAGEIAYGGDSISGELSGVWREGDGVSDVYQVGVGLGFALGDMFNLSLAAAMGQINTGEEFWGASALASVNLSDVVHAEIGVGHKDYDGPFSETRTGFLAGIYYDPVDQLTIGLEGEYIDNEDSDDAAIIDLVSVFRF